MGTGPFLTCSLRMAVYREPAAKTGLAFRRIEHPRHGIWPESLGPTNEKLSET